MAEQAKAVAADEDSMLYRSEASQGRAFREDDLEADLVVVGGGLAGTCCSITAARSGARVILVQDRPVLGGNASSEVRLWVLGATAHMGNNNRWAREGGVVDEVLVENVYRNREGNAVLFDTILLEKVTQEPGITLLLNTALVEVERSAQGIGSARAFCSQNSTMYRLRAPLFCDSSGDGALAYLAGAAFRMGAESAEEFDEEFAPTREYGRLLGHSIYFTSRQADHPVSFTRPAYALDDITRIPRFRNFATGVDGCRLWWMEYGGRLDTVHDTEKIKWELWSVAYGVWDHLKNSGKFPDAENLTLEWVGAVPGKRESRRFEGLTMLHQRDVVEQREHADAVAYGGWSIDLHPADGIFSERPGCTQWHSRGVYQIPYRCLVSRDIQNLFICGRISSMSHVAFGSTRVMATCAYAAQAVGMAAALCSREGLSPADLVNPRWMAELHRSLMKTGQHIPGVRLSDPCDAVAHATLTATSEFRLAALPPDGPALPLDAGRAQMLPLSAGPVPELDLWVDVAKPTTLRVELRTSDRPDNHTPEVMLACEEHRLAPGTCQQVSTCFPVNIEEARYVFLCLMANSDVAVRSSETRCTGVLSVRHRRTQEPPDGIGVDTFEIWTPERRPEGQNLAVQSRPPICGFGAENVRNGFARPTSAPNAWVADPNDQEPALHITWDAPHRIARVVLSFDTDFDHPMESVLMGHPESAMPFCVKAYRLLDDTGAVLHQELDNHQTRNEILLDAPATTRALTLQLHETHGAVPAALFDVRCYDC